MRSNAITVSRREALAGGSAFLALGATACGTAPYASSHSYLTAIVPPQNRNTVFHWVDILLQQVRDQRMAPPRAAYAFAAPMVAGFLAANAAIGRYEDPYGLGPAPANVDAELAYGVAFVTAASEAFQQPFLLERVRFKQRFADGDRKESSIRWGRQVGMAINRLRTKDGAEPSKVDFYLGRAPTRRDALAWTPTSPSYGARPGPAASLYARGLYPGHGFVTPWTMSRSSQFRADPFPDPRSPEFAEEFALVRAIGGKQSETRTADEAEIALFWEDGPWGITPPGHFLYIAIQVLQARGLDFIDMARAFALLGTTQADASINAWDNKYHFDIVRPETAICFRSADFGNPDQRVVSDPGWKSYIPTPNFPSYTSGHSTFGGAGAEMTKLLIGTDAVSFSHATPDQVLWPSIRGRTRHFTSLDQAAEENGWSRLYGGVHWKIDHERGLLAGRQIARLAHDSMFRRVP